MLIADDVALIRGYLEKRGDSADALASFERILDKYRTYLKAAERVTGYANSLRPAPYSNEKSINMRHARAIRVALGDAYLGGPLL